MKDNKIEMRLLLEEMNKIWSWQLTGQIVYVVWERDL